MSLVTGKTIYGYTHSNRGPDYSVKDLMIEN
jgi:hypothetical protein